MREMKHTACLHNGMRLYWGKKILEWTIDPDEASLWPPSVPCA